MAEPLVTIPGATAHHVLGQSSVTLGAGELNLLPAPAGSKHDLMLTVGSAGFSLHHDTIFGTLAGDSRAYVFSPEIEGVKGGLVKITLPEGVEEDNSSLSALQTKFEQALIAHGLLQPGRSGPSGEEGMGDHHTTQLVEDAISLGTGEPLVTIPQCIAAQVLGEEIAILSEGTLSVDVVPKSEKEEEPVLTLTVGNSAFLLYKNAPFGTLANDSRTYVFNPVSEGANEGFVAIVLPEPNVTHGAESSTVTPLQNELELVLVEHGLLKDGFGAAADEVSRSIREDSTRIAQRIRDLRLRTASAELSNVANSVSRGAEKGMQSLADVAHEVSGAVLGAAFVAGALVTNALAPSEAAESSEQRSAPARRVTGTTRPVGGAVGETKDVPPKHDADCKTAEDDYVKEAQGAESKAGRDLAGPSATNTAIETSDGSPFPTGVVRTSSEQNQGPKAEAVRDDLGIDQRVQRTEDDKDVVDTGML
ncbi:hypothetical protein V8D89_000526 [Ganoderma adspersum]